MPSLNNQQIQQFILNDGFVPLFTHTDIELCKQIVKASYDGGLRLFEFTNRMENSFGVFVELKKYCERELPGMLLGIGTIKNAQQAEKFINAGADFIISPLILEEIYVAAKNYNTLWVPGCATATEIGIAENLGISLIKVFPAKQLGGPDFIKAMKSIFPTMQLIATGGIEPTEEDLKKWFNAGVAAIGIGSQLFSTEWIEQKEFRKITDHIKSIAGLIQQLKKQQNFK